MTLRHAFVLSLLLTVLLTACSDLVPTGTDRADQATSAQQFIPDLEGYARSNATNVTDAIAALGGSASLLSGNPALLVAIETIEGLIECYEGVGAVAAGIYTPPVLESLLAGQGLSVGAAAVINQERLSRNFLSLRPPRPGALRPAGQFAALRRSRQLRGRQRTHPLPLRGDRPAALLRLPEPLRRAVAPSGRTAFSRKGG